MSEVTTSRYRIRRAREADLPALADLLEEQAPSEGAPERGGRRRALMRLLRDESALLLVAEQRGEVVGMASCQVSVSTVVGGLVGWVEDLRVRADRRRRGIGSALLSEVEGWAGHQRLCELRVLAAAEGGAVDFLRHGAWAEAHPTTFRRRLG